MAFTQIAESDGGARIDLRLDFRIDHDDDGTTARTGLDLAFATATRTQSLRFGVTGGLQTELEGGTSGEITVDEPGYTMNYEFNNGRTRAFADLSYRERDVDGFSAIDDGFDEIDLIEDDGTRIDTDMTVGLELGLTDPVTAALSYRVQRRDFTGTSDPDLTDEERRQISGQLRFRIDPSLTLRFDAVQLVIEEEDAFDTRDETQSLTASLDWQIAPELRFTPRIGYGESRVEQTILGTREERVHRGAEFGFDLQLARPNGSYTLSFDRDFTQLGARHEVYLRRSFDLPGAEVSAQIGIVDLPNGTEAYPVGRLSYERDLRQGAFTVTLAHTASVNNQDDQVLRTSLQARYRHQLAGGASLSLSGSFIESDFTDPTEADLSTAQLSLNYAMPLTEDWDFSAGVSHRETREEGAGTDDEQRVFLSLSRSFNWRP